MSSKTGIAGSKSFVGISQRWPVEFRDRVNAVARSFGVSATQLTVDALELVVKAHSKYPSVSSLSSLLKKFLCPKDAGASGSVKKAVRAPVAPVSSSAAKHRVPSQFGYKKLLILDYLKQHADMTFANPQLADLLGLPHSTVRKYTRELFLEGKVELIPGRPNGVRFKKTK